VRSGLEKWGFLEPGRALRATPFGVLTSELYLDPLSAVILRRALERAPFGVGVFPLLAAIAATPDLAPLFLRRGEEREMLGRYTDEEAELLAKPEEDPYPQDLDLFLATIKTAEVLEAWLDETPIVEISERFGIGAGDLRAKVEDAEWLLFGASRIASRFQRRLARPLDDLSLRIRYGAREELLDLVHLRGIGRARGRALYNAGFPDRDSLRSAPIDRVSAALKSPRLAEAVLREVRHPNAPRAVEPSAPNPSPPPATPRKREPVPPRARAKRRSLEEYHTDPDGPATR
jgi:ATP-dependent DNA helicase